MNGNHEIGTKKQRRTLVRGKKEATKLCVLETTALCVRDKDCFLFTFFSLIFNAFAFPEYSVSTGTFLEQ